MKNYKIEIGTDFPFTQCTYNKYGHLVTNSLIKSLWLAISTLPISVKKYIPDIKLQRERDKLLIPTLIDQNLYSTSQLTSINRVRLRLRVTTLADVFTRCDRNTSSSKLEENARRIISTYKWPRSKPNKADHVIWADAIQKLPLLYTLGLWNNTGHSSSECLYDQEKDIVCIPNKSRWKKYMYQQQSRTLRSRYKYIFEKRVKNIPDYI